ncbi:MAG: 6-phosphogluconolactonase [Betaproteobacteria bacterium]|nr:6-phosphogluconolactonase [Betaproteobacteria bacterium]
MESPRWHACRSAAEVRARGRRFDRRGGKGGDCSAGARFTSSWLVASAARRLCCVARARNRLECLADLVRDERCLAADDPQRNSRMAGEVLLDHAPIPPGQVHVVRSELGAEQAAAEYCAIFAGEPEFDLVLPGLGEDGHAASLFQAANGARRRMRRMSWRSVPHRKPPAERVSLSARRLGRARSVLFLVTGEGAGAVSAWRAGAVGCRSGPTAGRRGCAGGKHLH